MGKKILTAVALLFCATMLADSVNQIEKERMVEIGKVVKRYYEDLAKVNGKYILRYESLLGQKLREVDEIRQQISKLKETKVPTPPESSRDNRNPNQKNQTNQTNQRGTPQNQYRDYDQNQNQSRDNARRN